MLLKQYHKHKQLRFSKKSKSSNYRVLFYDIVHDNIDVVLPVLDIVDAIVTHTRGHSFRIIKQQCRINARLNSFACRNVGKCVELIARKCCLVSI